MSIGDRVKSVRIALGMGQTEFAEILDTYQSNVVNIEKNRTSLSDKAYQALADRYNVNLNYLLTGSGSMFQSEANEVESWELRVFQYGDEKGVINLDNPHGITFDIRKRHK